MMRCVIPLLLTAGLATAQPASGRKPSAESPAPAKPRAAAASSASLEPEIRARIDKFFVTLKDHKVETAYHQLFEGSVLPAENPEMVKKLVDSTSRVLDLTGRIDSADPLKARSAGPTLREVTYVLNGEKRPLRWKFYFYFGDGRWQVLDTNVATDAAGFFEEDK